MITTKQKSTIDTYTKKKKEYKHNTKDNYQTREKRTKEEGKKNTNKTNPKQLTKWQ